MIHVGEAASDDCADGTTGWTDTLRAALLRYGAALVDSLAGALGLTFNSSDVALYVERGLRPKAQALLDHLLDYDDFQLQLLQVFAVTLVSIVALIFLAWHVYGPRISERFMSAADSSMPDEYKHPPT